MKKCFEEFGPEKIAEYNATFKSSMAYPNSGANRAAMKLYSSKDWLNEFWTNDVSLCWVYAIQNKYFYLLSTSYFVQFLKQYHS